MNLCVVQPWYTSVSETFIRAHVDRLPANVTAVHGRPPLVGDKPILSDSLSARISRFVARALPGTTSDLDEKAYAKILRQTNCNAVLAEYGTAGVKVMSTCEKLGIPLIVHFHGYDACRNDVISEYADDYEVLFRRAKAVVAVSREMREQLIALGAPSNKVFLNPCGVDVNEFSEADPAQAPPSFLTVGRFVPKKAPHLVVAAFANVHRRHPNARLRMIGDGPLREVCRDLASALKIGDRVEFLGSQPHHVVQKEMGRARAFIQHSVEADDGDKEGTPVVILEAGASGLPVISTHHAGIPDVVIHEETGLLVAERDVDAMTTQMIRLIEDPELATELGKAARQRVATYFAMENSIGRLWSIIESSVRGGALPPVDHLPDRKPTKSPRPTSNPGVFVKQ